MSLILKVLSYKGGPPQRALSCVFGKEGGSVGRSPSNRFILPDPERFVSRSHGNITFRSGVYHYTDTSTAGSYWVNRHLLVHRKAVVLTDGDVLRIGEYEIAVSVTPDTLTQTGAPPLNVNPFGVESAPRLAAASEASLFWGRPSPELSVSPKPFPPYPKPLPAGENFPGQPDVSTFHKSFFPPEPSGGDDRVSGPPDSDAESRELPKDFFKRLIPEVPDAEPFRPNFPNSTPMGSVSPKPEFPNPLRNAVPAAAGERDLFECFLEGAGLTSRDWMRDEELPEIMKAAGALLREFVAGMMTVLRARSEMKSQFQGPVTSMRAQENNPLKFAITADDALKLMLARSHPGFMAPVKAVRGGFNDLVNHQMAMNAGVQAALATALKRFDPQSFERLHEDVLIQKKAKCWEAFCKAYPGLVDDVMENFLGEEFADVYERQMHRLQSVESQ